MNLESMTNQINLPDWLFNISYNGKIIPNGEQHDMLEVGANCQVFAYYLLREHGFYVPKYRSSELWADTEFSEVILSNFQPFDILFFHKKQEAYGAHVAVYLGNNQAIHLSKRMNKPVIWSVESFYQYPEYQFLLGGKRFQKINI